MNGWLALALAGLVTFGLRCGVVVGLGDRAIPLVLERASSLLAPAVMAALAASSVTRSVSAGGAPGGAGWLVRITSVAVGGAVAVRTASVGRALVAGVACWLVVGHLVGS